jgi:hypothetical protein
MGAGDALLLQLFVGCNVSIEIWWPNEKGKKKDGIYGFLN